MGTIIHNFINIAISNNEISINNLCYILRLMNLEYAIKEGSNDYKFITIFPTGSKVGFDRYENYIKNLDGLKLILKSLAIEWVEVEFGETLIKIKDGYSYENIDDKLH